MAQHLDALIGHEAVVLDPHPEMPELVDARLDREHHPRLEARLVALDQVGHLVAIHAQAVPQPVGEGGTVAAARKVISDRKSTRLNSSHGSSSYAVFCLKKKNQGMSRNETSNTPMSARNAQR